MTTPEETAPAPKEETRALAVTRERLITEAPMAMFDSAAFEHLQRVATVIYRSGFVPRSLTHEGPGDSAVELPEAMVVARCVLLADQAQRAGADVIGYIQATSVINGRLMHEGKLVNAIVQRRMGIRLKYRFGLWDTDHIIFPDLVLDKDDPRFGEPLDPAFFHGAGERLAVRAFNPGSPDEFVEGSAGQWKTTRSGSPWTKQADWPRQLRYRAVREWARAYDPGTVLGMLADGDEEIEMSFRDVTPKTSGVMARLGGGENGSAGFDQAHVERETKGRGKRKPADAPAAPTDEAPATPAAEGRVDVLAEVLGGDDVPAEGGARPTETASVQSAEAGPVSSASATAASEASPPAEADSSPTDAAGAEPDVIADGYPNANEVYMLNGDEWAFQDVWGEYRRDTYKNGEPLSDAGRDKGYRIYEDHAPAFDGNADAALPPDFEAYVDAVESAKAWSEVKSALQVFQKTEVWREMTEEVANRTRANTWNVLTERTVDWLPRPEEDVSAFRMWIETTTDASALENVQTALTASDAFKHASEGIQGAILKAAAARIAYLKG